RGEGGRSRESPRARPLDPRTRTNCVEPTRRVENDSGNDRPRRHGVSARSEFDAVHRRLAIGRSRALQLVTARYPARCTTESEPPGRKRAYGWSPYREVTMAGWLVERRGAPTAVAAVAALSMCVLIAVGTTSRPSSAIAHPALARPSDFHGG